MNAISTCDKLFRDENFNAMISSSSHVTNHLIARELKNKYGLPWIADLRDLWTQNHYYHYGHFRKFIERRAEQLKELHIGKNISAITNGFSPNEKANGIPLSDKFCIIYTGFLYKGIQGPEPLFNALKQLILEKVIDSVDIVINFYGYNEGWLKRDIEMYDLQNVVNVHGLILREEAIKKQRESQLLRLLTQNDPNKKGVYAGKVFDYIAAQRPILSIGISGGVVAAAMG
ncbi:MAG TPA: hypothetical protein VN368_00065 [Candidatus Methylomirabilis sp.]|nr:hypothetical protein [Candidatus Methylomirabilis sp.]